MYELAEELARREPRFAALRARVQRARRWSNAAVERGLSRKGIALLTGIVIHRLTGLLSGERICSAEETQRLDAVLIEGRDLGDCGPCGRAPRRHYGVRRRPSANDRARAWEARLMRADLSMRSISEASGIKFDRCRNILRCGSVPTDAEREQLEAVLGGEASA